jgi:uncharacterized membrane protein
MEMLFFRKILKMETDPLRTPAVGGPIFKTSQKLKNRHGDFDWKKNSTTDVLNTLFEILSLLLRI